MMVIGRREERAEKSVLSPAQKAALTRAANKAAAEAADDGPATDPEVKEGSEG